MTYREMAIETLKIACQDAIEHAEEIVPKLDRITNMDIRIHIPTLTDDPYNVPSIDVRTDQIYCSNIAAEKIIDMLKKDCNEKMANLDRDGCLYWDNLIVGDNE